MIQPQTNAIYRIELCSGEQRRWRCLPPRPGETARWWRDMDSGREFSEASLLYAWRITARDDGAAPEERRAT